ncbi:MAG TPA: sigma-70 family RNA polymerase sigma factor [Gemmataceae bacterium]|nr:sigma-70 family RNA polymerase sigma factor [Gemmataceae bacterium]
MRSLIPDDVCTTLLLPMLSAPGAEDAWRVFLKRYWPLIVEWAKHGGAGRDDAEQIASEVLLKLSCGRALASFDRCRGRFRPWLRSVVRRAALDYCRALEKVAGGAGQGKNGADPLDILFDPTSLDSLADDLDARLTHDLQAAEAAIERVRRRVKPSSWEAFYRTAVLGNGAVETADDLGLSVSAVYVAKRRIGQMLKEEGQDALAIRTSNK